MPLVAETNSPVVCYVTDGKSLGNAGPAGRLITLIRAVVAAGVDWVQIREKHLPARDLVTLTKAAIHAATESRQGQATPARVMVNDRLDVALATGASGVHLGRESVPTADAVHWCRSGNAPPEFWIGVSCHSLADAREAEVAGASYIFFGPVFDTPSKRPFGPPQGIARLAEVCCAVRIPVIAIGGVDDENAAECLRAGAAGMAAIRLFQDEAGTKSLAERISKIHRLKSV